MYYVIKNGKKTDTNKFSQNCPIQRENWSGGGLRQIWGGDAKCSFRSVLFQSVWADTFLLSKCTRLRSVLRLSKFNLVQDFLNYKQEY